MKGVTQYSSFLLHLRDLVCRGGSKVGPYSCPWWFWSYLVVKPRELYGGAEDAESGRYFRKKS